MPSLHDFDVKLPIFTLYGEREYKETIFYFFNIYQIQSLEFNSRRIRPRWSKSYGVLNSARFIFDVFAAAVVVGMPAYG